ncbi:hypothetical protein PGT21_031519 [Puccinia graminis f. sp. tritici]|uniref:Hydrophobin n=1 Tax=Puccinia graminis f. sp. tritici TaxID=56615 RepID=A0A5B0NDL8_PUCGR|nr:hypothetical protein PGT21_031519 [Puccinia graminis f. sp. tritici]
MQSFLFLSALMAIILDVQTAHVDISAFACPDSKQNQPVCIISGNLRKTLGQVSVQRAVPSPVHLDRSICGDISLFETSMDQKCCSDSLKLDDKPVVKGMFLVSNDDIKDSCGDPK